MSAQDSGGYDDSNIEVKFQQAVQNITKYLGENQKLTKNQIVQTRKIIVQHEKKYNSDKDHWRWKDQDRQKQRKFAIEKIEMQGQQVRMNKQLSNAMKHNLDSYNYVKQSLTGGGRSLRSGILGVADSLALLTKSSKDLKKAEETLNDAKKSGGDVKGAQTVIDELKDTISKLGGNNRVMKAIVSKLEGLGKIMEKHQGKIMIGAGLASIMIGIITKALSVAPLFQAMMKLMQFAVTMILMPIGTFFGAVLRPLVIGFVKGTAKNFGAWMKTAMDLGTKLGQFIMDFLNDPAKAFGGLISNALGGDSASIAGTAAVGGGAVATAVVASKLLPNILKKVPSQGVTFATGLDDGAKVASKIVPKTLTKVLTSMFSPQVVSKFGLKAGTAMATNFGKTAATQLTTNLATKGAAKTLGKLALKAIPIVGWASLGLDVLGSGMKQFAPDQYQGVRDAGKGIGAFFGDTEGDTTEAIMDFLGFGEMSTAEQMHEGLQELNKMFTGEPVTDMQKSLQVGADSLDLAEKDMTKIGTEIVPMAEQNMDAMQKEFQKMEGMGYSMTKIMTNIQENFSLTDKALAEKMKEITSKAKKANIPKVERNLLPTYSSSSSTPASTGNFMGGADYVNPWLTTGGTGRVDLGDGTFMEDGVRKFDYTAADRSGRTMSSNEVANQAVRDEIAKSAYAAGASYADGIDGRDESGISRLHQLMPHLIPNYAGGQINEPILGIGRSGRAYSFGEHGSETVIPNGGGTGGGITINIARIDKNADFEQLKPMIQKWILEANSRRGMI